MHVTAATLPHASANEITEVGSSSTTILDSVTQQTDHPIETNLPYNSIVRSTVSPYENVYSDAEWDFALTDSNPDPLTGHQSPKPPIRVLYHEAAPDHQISNLDIMKALMFPEFNAKALKAFWPRRIRDNQFSLNKAYVLNTLRSLPSMLVPGKGQPPFIHPQCLTNGSPPGPLATCAAIVQMMSVRNESNAVFIWKAIRMEQERLSSEVCAIPAFSHPT